MGGFQVRAPGDTVPFCQRQNMKGHGYNCELSLTHLPQPLSGTPIPSQLHPDSACTAPAANVAEGWPAKLLSRGWCQPL